MKIKNKNELLKMIENAKEGETITIPEGVYEFDGTILKKAKKKGITLRGAWKPPEPDFGQIRYFDSNGLMELQLPKKARDDYIKGKTIHLILNKNDSYGQFKIENP